MKRPLPWITLYLLLQLLIPLGVSLLRTDPHDERFAWRMFSPERAVRCGVAMRVDGVPIALERTFHEAWRQLAARGRLAVVDRMADHVCRSTGGDRIQVRMVCLDAGATTPRTIVDSAASCSGEEAP